MGCILCNALYKVTVGTSLVSSENHFESYIKKNNYHTYLDKVGKRCKSIGKSTQGQFYGISLHIKSYETF